MPSSVLKQWEDEKSPERKESEARAWARHRARVQAFVQQKELARAQEQEQALPLALERAEKRVVELTEELARKGSWIQRLLYWDAHFDLKTIEGVWWWFWFRVVLPIVLLFCAAGLGNFAWDLIHMIVGIFTGHAWSEPRSMPSAPD